MSEKKSSSKRNIKKRNWAFFVYPTKKQLEILGSDYDGSDGYGSVPDDWIQRLQLSGLQYAISPLHDKDLLEDNSGKTKKPHYHVIVVYGSPTTYNNVKSLTDSLNSPIPQALEQVKGYYRYLTHKDNPDKYQYDERDIVTGGGFNIANFVELSRSEANEIKRDIQALIRERDIIEYAELLDYLADEQMLVEYDVATSNTILFANYIKSRRHSVKLQLEREKRLKNERQFEPLTEQGILVNEKTGEVVDLAEEAKEYALMKKKEEELRKRG